MGTVAPALAGAAVVLSRLSPKLDRAGYGAPGCDLVLARPEHVWQVVFRERSPSNGGKYHSSQASGEAWHGTLRREFSTKLDSHAAAVQELIDQRLEEKLLFPEATPDFH